MALLIGVSMKQVAERLFPQAMRLKERYTNSHNSNMKKAIIYEFDGGFDIHDEAGHMVKQGFNSHGEAVLWAKKKNLEILDIFLVVS